MFQYYFFAKSDLDLSIDFFSYLFCIFQINKQKRDRRGVTTDLGGGQGRNKQKRDRGGVTTDLGGGQGRNKQKRDRGGVTTDLLDV